MSTQRIQKGYANQLAVRLLDGSNNPVTGVAYSSVTVIYKKQGFDWVSKSLSPAAWSEGPDGRYLLLFDTTELDTEGRFTFRVSYAGADTFTGDVDVVADWATEVDLLQALLNLLGTKVSVDSIEAAKKRQDEAIMDVNKRIAAAYTQLEIVQKQAAAMLRKLP